MCGYLHAGYVPFVVADPGAFPQIVVCAEQED